MNESLSLKSSIPPLKVRNLCNILWTKNNVCIKEKKKKRSPIAENQHSNDIGLFYKVFSLKQHWCTLRSLRLGWNLRGCGCGWCWCWCWCCRRGRNLIGGGGGGSLFLSFGLELAVVAFLLEELDMVMFAVEFTFMCYIVWWANGTPSMGTLEADLVVYCPVHSNLQTKTIIIEPRNWVCVPKKQRSVGVKWVNTYPLNWVSSLRTGRTFFSGATKRVHHFQCTLLHQIQHKTENKSYIMVKIKTYMHAYIHKHTCS